MPVPHDPWTRLTTLLAEVSSIRTAGGLCAWDQQTYMPRHAHSTRADQMATLSKLAHEVFVQPQVGELLHALEDTELSARQRGAVRNLRREYQRATRVPSTLVQRLQQAQTLGFQAWVQAKEQRNFASLAPALEAIVELKREFAAAIDPSRPVYDILLEEYEPGRSTAEIRKTFARLDTELRELVDAVAARPTPPRIGSCCDVSEQLRFHRDLAARLGFDMQRGRLDASEHPFTIGLGDGDTRITTHLYPDDLLAGLYATLHEAGHGLYEQGLPKTHPGTTWDEAASVGMHESQSRFWENVIGRSRAFTDWIAPRLSEMVGTETIHADTLFRAANRVRRTPIRIFADEVTYNLHIIIRFELEEAMVSGRLAIRDLPEAWNSAYQRSLGIEPADDAEGVLQDVHWPSGAIGYFPTYTLGNLAAASLGRALEQDVPRMWDHVRSGDFAPILDWLRDRVHRHGQVHEAPKLLELACGPRDGVEDFLNYLWQRHEIVYGVGRPAIAG